MPEHHVQHLDGYPITEWKKIAETAERMQRVAEGQVQSLEAHLEAIKEQAQQYDVTCDGCKVVLGILDGSMTVPFPVLQLKAIKEAVAPGMLYLNMVLRVRSILRGKLP